MPHDSLTVSELASEARTPVSTIKFYVREGVLTPGLESGDMFTDLYAVMRERRGLAQVAGVSVVFLRYASSIQFKAPVRFVMTAVSAIARLFGFGKLPPRVALPARAASRR
jgi:hypothetical protein